MQFKVFFTANKKGNYYPSIRLPNRSVGLDLVDQVRSECGITHLSLEVFNESVSPINCNHYVNIPEQIARAARQKNRAFSSDSIVNVQCAQDQLNGFVTVAAQYLKDDVTGEIKRVDFKYEINNDLLVNAWIEAGCPLDWRQPKDAALTETSCAGNTDFAYEN
jgi:hypothetical protein